MPIYKRCSRCGRRLLSGSTCPCIKERHKEYDRYSRDRKSQQYYHSKEWMMVREAVLDMDGGIDVYLYMKEGKAVLADTVHHIVPLKDDWNKRNDMDNLISLSADTHSLIERMYQKNKNEMERELQEMLRVYRKTKG